MMKTSIFQRSIAKGSWKSRDRAGSRKGKVQEGKGADKQIGPYIQRSTVDVVNKAFDAHSWTKLQQRQWMRCVTHIGARKIVSTV